MCQRVFSIKKYKSKQETVRNVISPLLVFGLREAQARRPWEQESLCDVTRRRVMIGACGYNIITFKEHFRVP